MNARFPCIYVAVVMSPDKKPRMALPIPSRWTHVAADEASSAYIAEPMDPETLYGVLLKSLDAPG